MRSDAAQVAIELADAYGIGLGEAQRTSLTIGLSESVSGWAARTFGECKPRQQGKNNEIEVREIAGMTCFGEKLHLHTAHQFPTSNEAFIRMEQTLMNHDDLRKLVDRPRYANDEKGFDFRSGGRIRYRSRTKAGGIGFAEVDLVVYDEAQEILPVHMRSLGPTGLANPNSQSWFAGTGGYHWSQFWWRMRRRALSGGGAGFGYVEHSAQVVELDADGRVKLTNPVDMMDVEAWVRAMPRYNDGLVTAESVLELFELLGPQDFGSQGLNLWEPESGSVADGPINMVVWNGLIDAESMASEGTVRLAFDITPMDMVTEMATFGIAGYRPDKLGHVAVRDRRPGTSWVVARGKELSEGHNTPIIIVENSPAKRFIDLFVKAGVKVDVMTASDYAVSTARLIDGCKGEAPVLRHRGDTGLRDALDAVQLGKAGDGGVSFSRSKTDVDITPLTTVTAAWGRIDEAVTVYTGGVHDLNDYLDEQ